MFYTDTFVTTAKELRNDYAIDRLFNVRGFAVAASAASPKEVPRAADGHPDLSGIWTNVTITPLERPRELAGKEFFTEQEAIQFEKDHVRNRDNRDARGTNADVANAYNDFWWDSGTKVVKTRRTSIVVDPPDGRVPRVEAGASTADTSNRSGEKRSLRAARLRGGKRRPAGTRRRPGRQAADGTLSPPLAMPCPCFRALTTITTRSCRIKALWRSMSRWSTRSGVCRWMEARTCLPTSVSGWGDSRGHWEGDTLLIDTTNFTDKTAWRGSDENLHLIERLEHHQTPIPSFTALLSTIRRLLPSRGPARFRL